MTKIIPAIYALSITELDQKLEKLASFSDEIQIDIMDGEFVKEESFEIIDLKDLPTGKEYEFHLMVAHPLEYLPHLKRLGIKKVIFHNEIDEKTVDAAAGFKKEGLKVFLAVNPESDLAAIKDYIALVDGVMLMSVTPGKPGQELIRSVLAKARYLREKHPDLVLEMDGGINKTNIKEVFDAGVNVAVVGSGILKAENPAKEWEELGKFL